MATPYLIDSIQSLNMSNPKVQHFSHPHSLTPFKQDQELNTINCKACQRRISEPFHGCSQCNYYLHDKCLEAPRSLSHPSHPSHHLTLLPVPTYPSPEFQCDGCGLTGNAFSYSCSLCSFDLHMHCARSPTNVLIDKHPHELQLVFDSEDRFRNVTFICDICHLKVDLKRWFYYCDFCDYGTHLQCALSDRWPLKLDQPVCNTTNPDEGHTQHNETLPLDRHPTTDKEVVKGRNDCLETTCLPLGQKSDGRADRLSLAIDEVTEIQIMVAKLQNLLSKAHIDNRAAQH